VHVGAIVHAQRNPRFQQLFKGTVLRYDATLSSYEIEFIVTNHGMANSVVREMVPAKRVLSEPFSVLSYFKQRKNKFPTWFAASKILALMQPSSAAAERVFSLLESFFGKMGRRGAALADVINCTLKLRSHDRTV
jgi:hypothetical protein